MANAPTIAELEARLAELSAEWALAATPLTPEENLLLGMKAEVAELRARGEWESGPADLLSVIGREGDERFHCSIIAWLARPAGRHGLGTAFVTRLLERCWPGGNVTTKGLVTVRTEVTERGQDDQGKQHESRADIVISAGGLIVVIESKVGAGEQDRQCERLYWSWNGKAADVRWVFLNPFGLPPQSVHPARAGKWRTITYRDVRAALAAALDDTTDRADHPGRMAARQYLTTLDAHRIFTGGSR